MVQKIEEQKGHILLHFGSPPADLGKIEFVVIVAYRQEQILYAQWRADGSWTLPSGRVEPGETAEEAAHRELLEETGATLKNMDVLCYMHCFMFGSKYWGATYLGEIDKQDVPTDLNEVMRTAMFADVPNNVRHDFGGQAKALHHAALDYLANSVRRRHDWKANTHLDSIRKPGFDATLSTQPTVFG